MVSKKLKPCPFCGGKAIANPHYKTTFLGCSKCLACADYGDTLEEAAENWNKRTSSEWISVDEQLPDSYQDVLAWVGGPGTVVIDSYSKNEDKWLYYSDVTHWMPMPEGPK